MKITVLVDNVTKSELKAKHGLSLYIETCKNKILFDLGSDKTFIDNAKLKNIDLSEVDIVIILMWYSKVVTPLYKFMI